VAGVQFQTMGDDSWVSRCCDSLTAEKMNDGLFGIGLPRNRTHRFPGEAEYLVFEVDEDQRWNPATMMVVLGGMGSGGFVSSTESESKTWYCLLFSTKLHIHSPS